ncbi:MAG: hypothetical protein R3D34_10330 [Nitratireductor sp.]|nr:hypothetical protein [Nitratireductor sp.]MCB1451602.1 hypothetical protein [Nitratireductor sp.]
MQFVLMLVVLVSGAAYLGYLPGQLMIVDMPLSLIATVIILASAIYVIANFNSGK